MITSHAASVTVVLGGHDYICTLDADMFVTVTNQNGDAIARVRWIADINRYDMATLTGLDVLNAKDIGLILDHASDAWLKHGR